MRNITTVAPVVGATLTACVLTILSVSLAEAVFGPRTVVGKNYQQYSDTQSFNGIDPGSNCGGTAIFCYVVFHAAPQQQQLIVQHVACHANVNAGGLRIVYLGSRKGQTFPHKRTPLVPVSTTDTHWAVNSPVMHLLKSGERPVVLFLNSVNTSWFVECSISGKLQ